MGLLSRLRRRKLRKRDLPPEYLPFLDAVPLYRRLPEADRQELRRHMVIFLAEKRFEGCVGLVVTDEMKVTVAANACVLLLHRQTDYFPCLSSIVMYPKSYFGRRSDHDEAGVVHDGIEERLGESWAFGTVVLSWKDILADAEHCDDMNVILHEFAHQLDAENGADDGVPLISSGAVSKEWEQVLGAEFERLREEDDAGTETFLDPYGAESPAEFFAVVTETFFQLPHELKREHPHLYTVFSGFFGQDPASWAPECCAAPHGTATVFV